MLTLEEQERRAYADGDVHTARLLALAIDAESEAIDGLEDEVADLRHQNDELQAEVDRLNDILGLA